MSSEAIVTIPPDVVRMRASSTVFVNASKRVNRDFGGMVQQIGQGAWEALTGKDVTPVEGPDLKYRAQMHKKMYLETCIRIHQNQKIITATSRETKLIIS